MSAFEVMAEFATRKADALEALAEHVRELGHADRADGLMMAVRSLRADATVFERLNGGSPEMQARRLRLVKP